MITGLRAKLMCCGRPHGQERTPIANTLTDRSGAFDTEAPDHPAAVG